MQKNELSMQNAQHKEPVSSYPALPLLTDLLEKTSVMQKFGKLYSKILGEKVSSRQAVYYLYAQFTGFATLMPFNLEAGWRCCFLLLFVWSVGKTRQ